MKLLFKHNLSKKILIWYDKNKRDLPWRMDIKETNPYKTWVSEIMLQQTTVEAVKPYYHKFISKWPSVKKLADSELEDIMDSWSGLGYYSRAKNLHKTAKILCKEYDTKIPSNYEELIRLPGIGPYTAGAILAIAYDKKAPVIDANIERILLRVLGIKKSKDKVKKQLIKISEDFCPKKRSGDYVQAMMDLGSMVCKPAKPLCLVCPIKKFCHAFNKNIVDEIPIKKQKKIKKIREANIFFIISDKNKVYLKRRPLSGLLPGMLEFPSSEWKRKSSNKEEEPVFPFKGNWQPVKGQINHTFSHFQLKLKVYICENVEEKKVKGIWIQKSNIFDLELPSLMKKVYKHVFKYVH